MSISAVDLAYTSNGNVYQKSKTGKKFGTAIGVAGTTALLFKPMKSLTKKGLPYVDFAVCEPKAIKEIMIPGGKLATLFKNFIMHPEKLSRETVLTPKALKTYLNIVEKMQKSTLGNKIFSIIRELAEHKLGRIGLVALAVALPIMVARGIGKIYDKIVDQGRKTQADNFANPFEANI